MTMLEAMGLRRLDIERPGVRRRWVVVLIWLCLGAGLAGCNVVGPHGLRSGRSLYNEALAQTQNEQVLLNLVRLRYRDAPVFLEVSTVATTYEFEAGASGSFAAGLDLSVGNPGNNSIGFGGSAGYLERPTMTMLPLQGERFATRLLTPIRPSVLTLMANSGWAIDRILAVTVQRMGGLSNAPSASGPTPDSAPQYESFQRFASLVRELQRDYALTLAPLREEGRLGEPDIALAFPEDARETEAYAEMLGLLGLDPASRPERLVFSTDQTRRAGTIPMTTRSLLSAMFYLSHGVEVSEPDARAGVVTTTVDGDGETFDWGLVLGDYFRIESGETRPSTAGPCVRYRGRWYWIDDRDLTSKSTLNVVHQLFALQSGQIDNVGPVLTIPVTGG